MKVDAILRPASDNSRAQSVQNQQPAVAPRAADADAVESARPLMASPDAPVSAGPVTRRPIKGSFVVAVQGSAEAVDLENITGVRVQRKLGKVTDGGQTTTWLQLAGFFKDSMVKQLVHAGYRVLWAEQNFAYEGDIMDAMPAHAARAERVNDPQLGDQHHLAAMRAIEAWRVEAGKPEIVVAVTDNGTDIDHEDLAANIYTNPREIAGNGIDDDGNGLIDDVRGWNFSGNNNNVKSGDHGTHTVGIVAATANNGKGIAGTAPGVRALPIKWAGDGAWTSAVIVSSYLYAANEGARIVSTSYNIDRWPGDAAIDRALNYMEQKGMLHFNSAGNSGREQPRRVALKNVILVASTEADGTAKTDVRSGFSNYGAGIDIAAPGSGVLSTMPNNRYARMSGTSMASPNAAAVAALVWSKNPGWTREQVWAQVYGTADNIDAKNPTLAGKMGGGRVNALRAVSERVKAPTLSARVDAKTLFVRFGAVFDEAAANKPESWRIERVSDGKIVSQGAPQKVRIATNELRFNLEGLPAGDYRLVASATHLKDPFGQALAGGDFVHRFSI